LEPYASPTAMISPLLDLRRKRYLPAESVVELELPGHACSSLIAAAQANGDRSRLRLAAAGAHGGEPIRGASVQAKPSAPWLSGS